MTTDAPKFQVTWELAVEQRIRENVSAKRQHERTCMDSTNDLLNKGSSNSSPYMVAIVGIPGSGKTTGSKILAKLLQDMGTLHMPFDGYHIPLATLAKHENSKDLIYRRGALETFDHESLFNALQQIRYNIDMTTIALPGFCHSKGDPDEGSILFHRNEHNIVICEGLYLLHDGNGWERMKDCFDLSIYIDADLDECMKRLKLRNKMIPGYTPEEIDVRVDAVDRVNAMCVERSRNRSDLIVNSAI